MARLPSAQDINRQIPTVERPVVNLPVDTTGRSLQQAGSALAQVGSQLQAQSARLQSYEEQVLEQERNKEIKLQQAFAQTGHLQDLNEWRANSQNDTDYATLPDRFEKYANDTLQRRSAGIMDNDVKTLFELSAKQNISNYKLKIRENAYTIRNQQLVAGFEDSFAKTTNQISATDDPAQIDALVKSQIQQLDGLIAIGAIPASKRPEAIRAIQNTVSYSKLDKLPADKAIEVFNGGSGVDFTTTGNQALDEVHKKVAAQTGTPYEFLTRNAQIESNGNPNAKNPESSAAGAQQITKGTAKSLGINPYDINQAALGAAQLYNEHKQRFIKEMGREPTDAELSAMHWLGSGDSMALFRAYDTDEKAFDILTRKKDASQARDIILNHRGNLDMTAAELLNIRINKYNGTENKELLKYLTPAQQKQLLNKNVAILEKQQKDFIEQQEKIVLADTVNKAITGEGYINPKDNKQMQMFDDVYNQQVLNNPDFSIEQKAIGTAEIVKNVGIIPNSLKGRMQQVFRLSNDSNEIAQFSDIFAKVQEQSPQVLNDIPAETKIMANYIAEGMRAGINISERVSSMRNAMLPENAPMIEKRKELLKADSFQSNINSNIVNLFDGWIPFTGQEIDIDTGINQLVANDYKTAFEQSYLMTEDADSAHKYASNLVKGQYAPSRFADGGIMKHPPEMYYSIPNDNTDWIMNQLLNDVNSESKLQKLLPENVFLMSDSKTWRQSATGQPSYKVLIVGDDGYISPFGEFVNENGKQVFKEKRFVPDRQKRLNELLLEPKIKEQERLLRNSAKTGVIPQ